MLNEIGTIKKKLTEAISQLCEGFNLMAHIQEKGWCFLIRIQDITKSRGIANGLDLPNTDEFDLFVDLSLTTK